MNRPSKQHILKCQRRRLLLLGLLVPASTGLLSGCATPGGPRSVHSDRISTNEPTHPSSVTLESDSNSAKIASINPDVSLERSPAVTPVVYEDGLQLAPAIELTPDSQPMTADFRTLASQEVQTPPSEASDGDTENDFIIEPVAAEPVSSDQGQPVEFFVQQALASHPRIQAARQRVAAATNVIPQARALPDPNFSNTFWPLHDQALQTAAGRIGNQMSLNQQIPFPEKLRAKAGIASREVQIAQAEVEAIEREVTESVRLAYYEVWFNTRAIAILEETKTLVDDLTEVAEARYKSGGSQQDVLRAQLENDRLDDQLINLRKQKTVAQADLAALLQQPVNLVPEASEELDAGGTPADVQSLISLAEQCNPSLRGLAWEIQRDREKQRLACLQQYPDFNLGVHWGLVSDDHNVISPVANGHDNLSFTFGTSLPIWREKINAGVREAGHRTASTSRRLDATRDEIYGKLRRLLAQADALIEQRDIYQERIVPRTEDTLKLAIADYRGERTDFFTLIETYRELLMFETQLARIEASLAGTVAQIDRTVGCPVSE